jgi:prepilin peptidase CpaA
VTQWPPDAAALAVVLTGALATFWDVWTRRVPNAITLGSAAIALAFHAVAAADVHTAAIGVAWSTCGWLFGLVLFLPVFLLGGLGAGDIKLLAAMGAWLGPLAVFWAAVYGSIVGGALAVPLLIARGAFRRTMSNLWALIGFWRVAGVRPHPGLTLENPSAIRLPYALPIAIGACLALWWRT